MSESRKSPTQSDSKRTSDSVDEASRLMAERKSYGSFSEGERPDEQLQSLEEGQPTSAQLARKRLRQNICGTATLIAIPTMSIAALYLLYKALTNRSHIHSQLESQHCLSNATRLSTLSCNNDTVLAAVAVCDSLIKNYCDEKDAELIYLMLFIIAFIAFGAARSLVEIPACRTGILSRFFPSADTEEEQKTDPHKQAVRKLK